MSLRRKEARSIVVTCAYFYLIALTRYWSIDGSKPLRKLCKFVQFKKFRRTGALIRNAVNVQTCIVYNGSFIFRNTEHV